MTNHRLVNKCENASPHSDKENGNIFFEASFNDLSISNTPSHNSRHLLFLEDIIKNINQLYQLYEGKDDRERELLL